METKKCKQCFTDIPKKAKRCSNCKADQRTWINRHPFITILIFLALITLIGQMAGDESEVTPSQASAPTHTPSVSSIKQVAITETQCTRLKDEFYSLIAQQPFEKTQLGKELLEQYAADGGIPVKRSNPNVRYTLPNSDCGKNLTTTLQIIVTGEKKALQSK